MKTLIVLFAVLSAFSSLANAADVVCSGKHGSEFTLKTAGFDGATTRFGRDTYDGSFHLNDEPQGTRLTGDKSLSVQLTETNGCWPGSVFHANLVLDAPDFTSGFGWFEVDDAQGKAMFDGPVDCKVSKY